MVVKAFAFVVTLAFASPLLAAGRPIAPTDLLAMARISDPQISPDGTRVLCTVATPDVSANRTARDVARSIATCSTGDVAFWYGEVLDWLARWLNSQKSAR